MKLEQENELEVVSETEVAQGVVHKRVDEEEPQAPEQPELPVEEAEEEEVILDLFGNPIEPVKPVKLPPAKAKTTDAPKAPSKPAAPKPEEKFGPEYQYAYAGHVGNLPEEDMTLERVREFLQVDFPELSRERTKMDIDKDSKLIVPMVLGAKKG